MIDSFLLAHKAEIEALCQAHEVEKLYAFGSIVDGRFVVGKSDIDLLIEFDRTRVNQKQMSKSLFVLWVSLQDLLGCKVDLITSDKLKGKYFKKYLDLYKEEIYSRHKEP